MKTTLLAFTLCLALAATAGAATKKGHRSGTSTLPPQSKMIVMPPLPPIPQVAERPAGDIITTDIGGRDLQFLTTAVENGVMIAAFGQLAKTRAESGAIKDVGSALANTQADENKQLVRLAALKGVTLSTEPPEVQAKLTEELDKLTGSNFDKACMDRIIVISKEAVAGYEGAAASKDGDIKNFSEQMLPISKEKLRLAEKMTGAGMKAARTLFRTGAKPLAATPAPPAPTVTPGAKPSVPASIPPSIATPAVTTTPGTPRIVTPILRPTATPAAATPPAAGAAKTAPSAR